ncbi:hypothetical protein DV113_003608 [Geotrichum candidum]|nr:hypothetical protein DV113_003608 [Geotrichum candidum]
MLKALLARLLDITLLDRAVLNPVALGPVALDMPVLDTVALDLVALDMPVLDTVALDLVVLDTPVLVTTVRKINKASSSTATNNSYSDSKVKQTVVYTDGASSNNGYASARAGYGVFYGDNDHRNKSARLSTNEPQTNQRAELHAIVDALQTAVDTPNSDSKNIRVMTDSKYSRDCLTSWGDKWETNGYKSSTGKQVQNQDLIKNGRALMEQLKNQGGSIEIEHVKGHADNYGNNQADKLAVHGRNK